MNICILLVLMIYLGEQHPITVYLTANDMGAWVETARKNNMYKTTNHLLISSKDFIIKQCKDYINELLGMLYETVPNTVLIHHQESKKKRISIPVNRTNHAGGHRIIRSA